MAWTTFRIAQIVTNNYHFSEKKKCETTINVSKILFKHHISSHVIKIQLITVIFWVISSFRNPTYAIENFENQFTWWFARVDRFLTNQELKLLRRYAKRNFKYFLFFDFRYFRWFTWMHAMFFNAVTNLVISDMRNKIKWRTKQKDAEAISEFLKKKSRNIKTPISFRSHNFRSFFFQLSIDVGSNSQFLWITSMTHHHDVIFPSAIRLELFFPKKALILTINHNLRPTEL